jgi:hypothetical protein
MNNAQKKDDYQNNNDIIKQKMPFEIIAASPREH